MNNNKVTKPSLSKDLFISDAVALYPEVVPIFMEYGLHCVSCFVAEMETIDEGAKAHGMSEPEIENMLLDAQEAIDKTKKD